VEKELEKIEDQIRKSLADSIRKSFADSNFGDVMVVGGGIGGIQASLDLAAAECRKIIEHIGLNPERLSIKFMF